MSRARVAALFLVLLTFLAYWPGLRGGFLFDDFGTLPALGAYGPVDNWETFWRYVTSGGGDPTGRPLAMLSFLADARNWPADPFRFKCTNLALHLLNGLLLMLLLRKLGRSVFQQNSENRADMAAVLAGAFWMLQPLLVSTTLYVVQRETMLCASFVLLGLLAWLRGRQLLLDGRSGGVAWMVIGLGACTTLALLSKANGMLLPALALTIELVLLRACTETSNAGNRTYRLGMFVLAVLPTALVVVYLVEQGWSGLAHGISNARPWTLSQRLLSEPRVLLTYLQDLLLPRPFTTGLFNDQFRASTSLWMPATTLPAMLLVTALILGGWRFRYRWPTVALAILFYFAGQLLESTTIPLELYFEHRNYLPAAMMYWPLCLWLCGLPIDTRQSASAPPGYASANTWTIIKSLLAIVLVLGVAGMTHAAATLWGDVKDQAELWAALNPTSARAQTYAAIVEMNNGHPDLAAVRLKTSLSTMPQEAQLTLNLFTAECALGHITPSTLDAVRYSLRTTRDNGPLLLEWFDNQIAQSRHPSCPELNLQTLHGLLDSALANPKLMGINGRRQDLYHLQGQLALAEGDADLALRYFDHALDQQVDAKTALNQASQLGSAGFPAQGLAHLDYYAAERITEPESALGMPRIHAWLLARERYWPKEIARLRATLSADALHHREPADDAIQSPR